MLKWKLAGPHYISQSRDLHSNLTNEQVKESHWPDLNSLKFVSCSVSIMFDAVTMHRETRVYFA